MRESVKHATEGCAFYDVAAKSDLTQPQTSHRSCSIACFSEGKHVDTPRKFLPYSVNLVSSYSVLAAWGCVDKRWTLRSIKA